MMIVMVVMIVVVVVVLVDLVVVMSVVVVVVKVILLVMVSVVVEVAAATTAGKPEAVSHNYERRRNPLFEGELTETSGIVASEISHKNALSPERIHS